MPSPEKSADRPLGLSSIERIGNTPLLRLGRIARDFPNVELLGKAEWLNPGGSVKDRAASNIVAQARASGKLGPGKTLLDSTSGNTGIAFAMIGAALGFPVTLCMPDNVSVERKRIVHAYGAKVIFTDPAEGSDGAIRKVRELYAAEPDRYFYADQYSNDANWQAHYHGTANEIWQQTEGRVTHFVAMLGTSGTFVGTSRRLKELNPRFAACRSSRTLRSTESKAPSTWRRPSSPRFTMRPSRMKTSASPPKTLIRWRFGWRGRKACW